MSTQTDVDIEALVGEMEAPVCELRQHTMPNSGHGDGPATHYISGHCHDCGTHMDATPVCAGFINTIRSNRVVRCSKCETRTQALDVITILGPVNK